ncbi:hypothetical protein BTZ20_0311 [Rhodococcus sp. MTM3W5.2]|nr:hypothetical protein BTZ20_0311 [Rhodococcus sp. MTM3W5.2]
MFDTYWRFAAKRHAIYEARQSRLQGPWTSDAILRDHRFTNCYRAADRVSQYLIRNVAYRGSQEPREVVFRVLLFKFFNRISTWELLEGTVGEIAWSSFDVTLYDKVLTEAFNNKTRLYSAAYVVPPPALGATRKHTNHLRLLQKMMNSEIVEKLQAAATMEEAYRVIRAYPAIGDFLAYQYLIDVNYSTVTDFDEMDFVVPGPGARDGIRKCFGPRSRGLEAEIIRYMADTQEAQFRRLGLRFDGLAGRPLQLIDCQNLFCEVDKYARVAHPDITGVSGRTKIKQKFAPLAEPVEPWFPPKWGLLTETAISSGRIASDQPLLPQS